MLNIVQHIIMNINKSLIHAAGEIPSHRCQPIGLLLKTQHLTTKRTENIRVVSVAQFKNGGEIWRLVRALGGEVLLNYSEAEYAAVVAGQSLSMDEAFLLAMKDRLRAKENPTLGIEDLPEHAFLAVCWAETSFPPHFQ